jgi:hypothetical protein
MRVGNISYPIPDTDLGFSEKDRALQEDRNSARRAAGQETAGEAYVLASCLCPSHSRLLPAEPAENKGKARPKEEKKEEKAARKKAAKAERQVLCCLPRSSDGFLMMLQANRARKKALKQAFKEEEKTQMNAMKGQPVGKSVLHL